MFEGLRWWTGALLGMLSLNDKEGSQQHFWASFLKDKIKEKEKQQQKVLVVKRKGHFKSMLLWEFVPET